MNMKLSGLNGCLSDKSEVLIKEGGQGHTLPASP